MFYEKHHVFTVMQFLWNSVELIINVNNKCHQPIPSRHTQKRILEGVDVRNFRKIK